MIIGRESQCPYCLKTFILSFSHIKNKKIHCGECSFKGKLKEIASSEIVIAKLSETISETEMEIFGSIFKKDEVKAE